MRIPKPRPCSDPRRPNLKFRVEHVSDGKRIRRFFETKRAANIYCQEIQNDRLNLGFDDAGILTDEAKREAADAIRRLKEIDTTLREAVDFFLKHAASRKRSKEISVAVEEWLTIRRKDGSRPRTIKNLESRSKKFVEKFEGRLVAEIEVDDLDGWLAGMEASAQTKKHYRAVAGAFFNWAQIRRYCDKNPVELIPIPDVKRSDPRIFTPKEMRIMLKAAIKEGDPEIIAWLVLCGFVGLRAEEAERMEWTDVNFTRGNVDVRPEVSKTGTGRKVALEPNAAAFLKPIRKARGQILQDGWVAKTKVRSFKAGLGFDWPQNGLRHSFASYHLYRGQDAGKTAMALGHQGNPQMLFKHYRREVEEADAKAWFSIVPPKTYKGGKRK